MTGRWVGMLLGLVIVGALALAVLVCGPLTTARISLVGTWTYAGGSCPNPEAYCIDTLYLRGNGHFRYIAFHSTTEGRWSVPRSGVMVWNGEVHGYAFQRVRGVYYFSQDSDSLTLRLGSPAARASVLHRVW